ncbi:unnamed protein product [Linum tenue]|uniref:Pectinesterase n=1 Tax=Linum tenue TaxID=586396 RepID=A0AAV0K9U8_9ROSI|nr:unnamed protein product [Linum tenue]
MSHQHKPLRSGLSISTVFLILFLIGTVAAAGVDNAAPSPSPNPEYNQYHLPSSQQPQTNPGHNSNHHAVLRSACSNTRFPDLCFSAVAAVPGAAESLTTQKDVIEASINITCRAVQRNFFTVEKLIRSAAGRLSRREKTALHDCLETIDETLDELRAAYRDLNQYPYKKSTLLSAAMTNQETCLDGFSHDGADRRAILEQLNSAMENSTELASNSLAIVTKVLGLLSDFNIPIHRRRRLMTAEAESDSGFPRWVSDGDRRMLQQVGGAGGLRPNVTVAQDGSGNFTTIAKAVELIPKKSLWKYIIYIKQGTYKENVILDKHRWNVLVYGDGKDKTIVSGSLNFVDGTPTFDTATFAVQGKNFMARDMKFINTAGPEKHQAVAFRSGADMSVYYRCSFDAYQDTLYPHSNRQFYRDCDITGTIDFIFGNAAVVFQGCKIQPRQPMSNQFNTITAQGKKDPNQNTGISIQKCDFTPLSANLTARTYLGRPWKDFSTTVIMQSSIGGFLNQLGWLPWVSGVEPPNTIFYAEYQNTGPGSSVAGRVKWAGYKPALTKDEAARFTVGSFIQGGAWLPATSVAFDSAL